MDIKIGPRCCSRGCYVPSINFVLFGVIIGILGGMAQAHNAAAHPNWPAPGQLFVGTCCQPIDRSPDQFDRDIAIMHGAGFNVVRMGDLSWDSFELSQGKFEFEFEWFDKIMDKICRAHASMIIT